MKCGKSVRAAALVAMFAIAGVAAAQQQAYPVKPIRLIVPYPPGGTTSTFARLVGEKVTSSWGYNVIVDNRPGGNTIIGTEALTRAVPDGHTIMFMDSAHVINPSLVPHLPYTAIRDFSPIGTMASTELLLAVHPSVPASTLKEFLAYAKTKPGQLNYASSGTGSVSHLSSELLNMLAGVSLVHVPYKGAAAALTDLIGGHVEMIFNGVPSVLPHIQSGRVRGIAIGSLKRFPALPEVPTFDESGLKGYEATTWFGLMAPAKTPRDVITRLNVEVDKALKSPDIKERFLNEGVEPMGGTPEQFGAFIRDEINKYAKVVKAANLKGE